MTKIIILIFILVGIALYLIIRASDETRTFKVEKNKVKINIFSLVKQNVQLFAKNIRLNIENKKLKETNADLRSEHDDYRILKHRYSANLISTKLDLEYIQKLNTSNMTDKELIQERCILTENIIKDLTNKIKELDSSENQSSSN